MTGLLAAFLLGYVLLVLGLGAFSARRSGSSPEEYYLAGRGLGTFVLFMALFGTNATTFLLVAIPALAYHDGIGIFSVNVPLITLVLPLGFWAVGLPARAMASRLGALTPAELYARRFGSKAVGWALFAIFSFYTLPYMVQAVKGVGLSLAVATDDGVPVWAASLAVTVVAVVYTLIGGMRATAWTNVAQGSIFLGFLLAALVGVASGLGGVEEATRAVAEHDPDLLRLGGPADYGAGHGRFYAPGTFASWGLAISLTVIGFPHMLVRLMAAGSTRALKRTVQLYPLAMVLLWLPAIVLGVWGAAAFPGLEGKQSDQIFTLMTTTHLPPWLGALGQVALLAAVMSTLDAQILTLSSMLVRDVLGRGEERRMEARAQVRVGRLFAGLVGLVTYVLALTWGDSVFEIGRFAFEGYVTLIPVLVLGVRWRRCSTAGALASLVAGTTVLLGGKQGWYDPMGAMPVVWALGAAVLAAVLVSLAVPDREGQQPAEAFGAT